MRFIKDRLNTVSFPLYSMQGASERASEVPCWSATRIVHYNLITNAAFELFNVKKLILETAFLVVAAAHLDLPESKSKTKRTSIRTMKTRAAKRYFSCRKVKREKNRKQNRHRVGWNKQRSLQEELVVGYSRPSSMEALHKSLYIHSSHVYSTWLAARKNERTNARRKKERKKRKDRLSRYIFF